MHKLRKGNKVYMDGTPDVIGVVLKCGRNGDWVDVQWNLPNGDSWRKRQRKPELLLIYKSLYRIVLTRAMESNGTLIELTDDEIAVIEKLANENNPVAEHEYGPEIHIYKVR